MEQSIATIIASLVAAIAALLAAWNTRKLGAMQLAFQRYAEEQRQASEGRKLEHENSMHLRESLAPEAEAVRKKLRELAELSQRVATSIRRLLELSRTLEDEKMMVETAQTMSIVADLFSKSDAHTLVIVPEDAAKTLREVHQRITKVFLELDYDGDIRRKHETTVRLREQYKLLVESVAVFTKVVHSYVAPQLQKVKAN